MKISRTQDLAKGFAFAVSACRFIASSRKKYNWDLLPNDQSSRFHTFKYRRRKQQKQHKDYARFAEISPEASFELETKVLIAQQVGLGNTHAKTEFLEQ